MNAVASFAIAAVALSGKSAPICVMDLSGTWTFTPLGQSPTTIQVPGGGWYKQGFTTITQADYQRTISIPNLGEPQITKLEFGAVNYEADVYLNGNLVGSKITSFTPSCFDLTSFVTPGKNYALKVTVKGRKAFIVNGKSIVPNAAGWSPNTPQGIFRSAKLVIYPQIYISDIFVRPSVSKNCLYCDVWVRNGSATPRNLTVAGSLSSWNGHNWAYPHIPDKVVSIAAGSTSKITVGPVSWNPGSSSYWWPNVPYQTNYQAILHYLNLKLRDGAAILDTNSIRFGFRELTQHNDGANTCYFLNEIRVNFRGDSLQGVDYDSIFYKEGYGDAYDTLPGFLDGTGGWAKAVDNYERLNYNFIRLHQEPVTPYMLDVCDECGLMVMEETAIRGSNNDQDFVLGFTNMINHLVALYIRDRNHPCIVRQSLSNEPDLDSTDSTNFEIALYNAAMSVDGTRPLSIDSFGNFYNDLMFTNVSVYRHYGNGVSNYTEMVWARSDRPYGQGEFVWNVDNTRKGFAWFATATQAMRRQGASDVRPYTLLSAWAGFVPGVKTTDMTLEQGGNPLYGENNLTNAWSNPQIQRIQAGFNPVLVADYNYWNDNHASDEAGKWPANIPVVQVNQSITRTLYVYNDTFSGTSVDVGWELRQESPTGAMVTNGAFNATIPFGHFNTNTITFKVPGSLNHSLLYLVLYSQKRGVEMFRETSEEFTAVDEIKLIGTPFGTSPAFQTGTEYDKATDGDSKTYFDYSLPNGGYAGIDLGSNHASPVSAIIYSPRIGFESRMIEGQFQGSNDGTNYTTLYTIHSVPAPNTRVAIDSPISFRFLRYVGPTNSYGNIAEMAFMTSKAGR